MNGTENKVRRISICMCREPRRGKSGMTHRDLSILALGVAIGGFGSAAISGIVLLIGGAT